MFLFKTIASLQKHLQEIMTQNKTIGFVPTMGALHDGHSSLISHSIKEGHYTVASIFVNPTQFNDPIDLEKYPRPMSDDLERLHRLDCDVLFLPSDEEIYPLCGLETVSIDLGHLGYSLEAAFRPGHFEGVLQVMHRLLSIVKPDFLFMGLKDLQQIAVVRLLIKESDFSCQLVGLPIIRESNGLARSSRNERLSEVNRQNASIIYDILRNTFDHFHDKSLVELKKNALKQLNHPPFRPEYFEFVQSDNLRILTSKEEYQGPVSAVTAVWCGEVRLIDNMKLRE